MKKTLTKKRKLKKLLSMDLNKGKYALKNFNHETFRSLTGIKKNLKNL